MLLNQAHLRYAIGYQDNHHVLPESLRQKAYLPRDIEGINTWPSNPDEIEKERSQPYFRREFELRIVLELVMCLLKNPFKLLKS